MPPQRPTSVTVLAIIGLVLGTLGMCCLGVSALGMFVGSSFGQPNPVLEAMRKDTVYLVFFGVSLVLGVAIRIVLLAASIGSLWLNPWARIGMLVYSWVTVVMDLLGTVFNIVYAVPLTLAAVPENHPGRVGAIAGTFGGVCGAVLGLIFPICVIYFFTRPHVIDAFRGVFPPAAGDERYGDEDRSWERPRGRGADQDEDR